MNVLKDSILAFAMFVFLMFAGLMMIDAYEQERTGECRDCLILKGWYER